MRWRSSVRPPNHSAHEPCIGACSPCTVAVTAPRWPPSPRHATVFHPVSAWGCQAARKLHPPPGHLGQVSGHERWRGPGG